MDRKEFLFLLTILDLLVDESRQLKDEVHRQPSPLEARRALAITHTKLQEAQMWLLRANECWDVSGQ